MHRAVEKNMLDIVDMFIQCGGDPTIQNKNVKLNLFYIGMFANEFHKYIQN